MGAGRTLFVVDELMGCESVLKPMLQEKWANTDYFTMHCLSAVMMHKDRKEGIIPKLKKMSNSQTDVTTLVLSFGATELFPVLHGFDEDEALVNDFSNNYQALIALIKNHFKSLDRVILVIPPMMMADNQRQFLPKMNKMYSAIIEDETLKNVVIVDLLNSIPTTSINFNLAPQPQLKIDVANLALALIAEGINAPKNDAMQIVSVNRQGEMSIVVRDEFNCANPLGIYQYQLNFDEKQKMVENSPIPCVENFKDAANGIMVLCGALGTIGAVMVGLTALAGLVALSATGIGLVAAGLVVSLGLFAGGLALLHKRHPEKYGFPQLCNSPGAAFNMPSGYFGPVGGMTL